MATPKLLPRLPSPAPWNHPAPKERGRIAATAWSMPGRPWPMRPRAASPCAWAPSLTTPTSVSSFAQREHRRAHPGHRVSAAHPPNAGRGGEAQTRRAQPRRLPPCLRLWRATATRGLPACKDIESRRRPPPPRTREGQAQSARRSWGRPQGSSSACRHWGPRRHRHVSSPWQKGCQTQSPSGWLGNGHRARRRAPTARL
mmetsp:Transcript_35492/g.77683  ORF Transcript_35492/g.77683 Transcript_35492/m.77683 type:complete len:200 (-) Transcript_35492:243-842(-)